MMAIPTLSNNGIFVGWDSKNKKQIEEAKTFYRAARIQNRKILDAEKKESLEHFNSNLGGFYIAEKEVNEGEVAFRFLDESGDRRIIWNMDRREEVEESQKKFQEYLSKGWRAYAVGLDGKPGRRIYSFDAEREEVFFEEKGIGEKLKEFVKKVSEVRVVPKTYPG